jgi:hypothetical protein
MHSSIELHKDVLYVLHQLPKYLKSRDSSIGIALGYGLDDWGSIPGGCWEFFS